jgi:hypothetical protein
MTYLIISEIEQVKSDTDTFLQCSLLYDRDSLLTHYHLFRCVNPVFEFRLGVPIAEINY